MQNDPSEGSLIFGPASDSDDKSEENNPSSPPPEFMDEQEEGAILEEINEFHESIEPSPIDSIPEKPTSEEVVAPDDQAEALHKLEETLEAEVAPTVSKDQLANAPAIVEPPVEKKTRKANAPRSVFDTGPLEPLAPFHLDDKLFNELISYADELHNIFTKIDELKRSAGSKADWEKITVFVATQKPRVTHMSSNAKSIRDKAYGDRFEEIYTYETLKNDGKSPAMEKVKVLVNRDVYEIEMISRRLSQSWNDLQDLLWSVKMVVENTTTDEMLPRFENVADDMFSDITSTFSSND